MNDSYNATKGRQLKGNVKELRSHESTDNGQWWSLTRRDHRTQLATRKTDVTLFLPYAQTDCPTEHVHRVHSHPLRFRQVFRHTHPPQRNICIYQLPQLMNRKDWIYSQEENTWGEEIYQRIRHGNEDCRRKRTASCVAVKRERLDKLNGVHRAYHHGKPCSQYPWHETMLTLY